MNDDVTNASRAPRARRSLAGDALRMCWRRRALWLAPVVLALLLARLLRRAGRPLAAPTVYTLH